MRDLNKLDLKAASPAVWAEVDRLRRESEGRRVALEAKTTEARGEWQRAENAEAEAASLRQRVADMTRALRLIRGLIPISEGNVAGGVLGALTVFAIAEAALASSDSK